MSTTYEKIDYHTYKRLDQERLRETLVTLEQLDGTIELLQQQLETYQGERAAIIALGVDGVEPVEEVIEV